MLTSGRWISLTLAASTLVAWAAVSGLRLTHQGPSIAKTAAHGPPRRIGDPTAYAVSPLALGRADVALRIAAALLVGLHLVILNLDRPHW